MTSDSSCGKPDGKKLSPLALRPGYTPAHRDRSKQMRCKTCGRFAYWNKDYGEWRLRCVQWDDYAGGYEHE